MQPSDKKVLIIDDDKLILKISKDTFLSAGFQVQEAENGELGLKIAETFKPDIILLDILMPIMDGMTMLKKLREYEWGREIPVIVLTSLKDSSNISTAMENKVFQYIIKDDFKAQTLLESAKEILSNH